MIRPPSTLGQIRAIESIQNRFLGVVSEIISYSSDKPLLNFLNLKT